MLTLTQCPSDLGLDIEDIADYFMITRFFGAKDSFPLFYKYVASYEINETIYSVFERNTGASSIISYQDAFHRLVRYQLFQRLEYFKNYHEG